MVYRAVEQCKLGIYYYKINRPELMICQAKSCLLKYSFKEITGHKNTTGWKLGGKFAATLKVFY